MAEQSPDGLVHALCWRRDRLNIKLCYQNYCLWPKFEVFAHCCLIRLKLRPDCAATWILVQLLAASVVKISGNKGLHGVLAYQCVFSMLHVRSTLYWYAAGYCCS